MKPVPCYRKLMQQLLPSEQPLLTQLQRNVTEEMLREIAAADYGQDVDQHLSALQAFEWGASQAPLNYWYPCEVLELTRWVEIENQHWDCDTEKLRQHWMRLYACTILLWNTAWPNNSHTGIDEVSTVIVFVESMIALGCNTTQAGLRFMSWRLLHCLDDDWKHGDKPHFPLAVLLLYAWLGHCDEAIVETLIQIAHGSTEEIFQDCMRSQLWHSLIEQAFVQTNKTLANQVHAKIKTFGQSLIEYPLH